jgi:hypothetical protein
MAVILVLAAAIRGEADLNVDPLSPTGDVTRLPFTNSHPSVAGVDSTKVTQLSTTNFFVYYNLAPAGSADGAWMGEPDWDGAMVYWLPWPTNDSSGRDLSSVTTFVFGVRGTATKVTVEFESADDTKTFAYLRTVSTNMQYYHIPKTEIANIENMKSISFNVYHDEVGLLKTGTYEVVVQGLAPGNWEIYPSNTAEVTRLPFTNNNARITGVDGTEFDLLSTSNFMVRYNLAQPNDTSHGASPDWDAVMVYWLPWATNSSWGYDLSSITTFVFKVRSTSMAQRVRVEFEASDTNKTSALLVNITNTWQYYHIPASNILSLTKIKTIVFAANYGEAGVGPVNTGTFEVIVGGLTNDPSPIVIVDPSPTTGEVTRLPGEPWVSGVDDTAFTQNSKSNFVIQ